MDIAEDLENMRKLAKVVKDDTDAFSAIKRIADTQKDILSRRLKEGGSNLHDLYESTSGKLKAWPDLRSFNSAFVKYLSDLDILIDSCDQKTDGVVLSLTFDSLQTSIDTMKSRLLLLKDDAVLREELKGLGLMTGMLDFAIKELGVNI